MHSSASRLIYAAVHVHMGFCWSCYTSARSPSNIVGSSPPEQYDQGDVCCMVQSFLWLTVYLVQLDHFSLCTAGRTDFQVVDGDSPAWHKPSGGINCQGCVEFHPGPKDVKHSSYSEERDWAEGARCTIIMHAHIWREMPCRAVFTYCLHSTADIYLHEQSHQEEGCIPGVTAFIC